MVINGQLHWTAAWLADGFSCWVVTLVIAWLTNGQLLGQLPGQSSGQLSGCLLVIPLDSCQVDQWLIPVDDCLDGQWAVTGVIAR